MTEQHEARLRAALRAEAEEVDVDPNAWSKVQRRADARGRRTPWLAVAAAVVVGGMAVGAGVLLLGDDDTTVDLVPAGDDSTTTTDPPVTTPTTAAPAVDTVDAVWPFTTLEEVEAYIADPGVGMFFDPEATALEFAREYLRMPDPHGGGEGIDAEGMPEDEAYLVVQPKQGSPMATTVHMRRYGGDDGPWSVTFTETRNIEVDRGYSQPQTGTIQLSGRSSAFEAQVDVEVRDSKGNVLGTTYVMGGGGAELEPFSGEIVLDRLPVGNEGAIIFATYSAEDGSLQEASVIPIRFATTGDATGTSFSLYFHRGEELVEVTRSGAATTGVLRQALDALVAGPRPEDGEGLSSLFSEDTAEVIAGVNLRDRTAIVDFADTVNNASTSAGSEAFLAELNATIFQFETVSQIEYRLQGSCEAFWEWLQRGGCEPVER